MSSLTLCQQLTDGVGKPNRPVCRGEHLGRPGYGGTKLWFVPSHTICFTTHYRPLFSVA